MPLMSRLNRCFVSLTAVLAFSSIAHGQTVIELTDPSQSPNPCVFTTNASGVTADPSTGHLRATGTFGQNCQTTPPPTPLINPGPANWVLPGDWTIGVSSQVQWAASNADLCVYDGSEIPAGQDGAWPWPTSGVACNSTSSCAAQHNLTLAPAVAGTYKFKLTCTYNGNAQTANVSEISATVSAAPTGCVAPSGWTRVTEGTVRYQSGTGPSVVSPTTKWDHVFGRNGNQGGALLPWPHRQGIVAGVQFGGRSYVSLEFTPDISGNFALEGSPTAFQDWGGGGQGISMTISTLCGDFGTSATSAAIPPTCYRSGMGGTGKLFYSVNGVNACNLTLGQKYYINMIYAALPTTSQSTSECATGGCRMQYQAQCYVNCPSPPQ